MRTDESGLKTIVARFVEPFYLSLLHGNLIRPDAKLAVGLPARLGEAARQITDPQLTCLLEEPGWRGRLTAAWFIGLTRRVGFINTIGRLLLASEMTYAGQGYCLALGLIGGHSCEEYLRAYLEKYLPLRGCFYDQNWAVGALACIRGTLPHKFLEPALWKNSGGIVDPQREIENFAALVDYLAKHQLVAAKPR